MKRHNARTKAMTATYQYLLVERDVEELLLDAFETENIADIDSYFGLMHTLFALEDRYGLTIETRDGEVLFRIDPRKGKDAARISEPICAWAAIAEKYRAGEISRDEYDKWRYHYPQYDDTQITAKVQSQELSDALVKALNGKIKE